MLKFILIKKLGKYAWGEMERKKRKEVSREMKNEGRYLICGNPFPLTHPEK
jgi:hypothetical protein